MNGFQLGLDELTTPANLRAYAAELIGTMFFLVLATGAVIAIFAWDPNPGAAHLVGISLAHGIAIATMVYATHHISGGHINPAVTLAMILTRNIKVGIGVVYIIAQLAGALLGTALLYAAVVNDIGNMTNFGAHGVNTAVVGGDGGALLVEILITAALVAVIFATAVSKKGVGIAAPLAIGLTVFLFHMFAVPMTGASANPARTFAPALLSNAFDSFWLYVLGPSIGAIIAAVVYHHVFRSGREDEEEAET